MVYDEKLTERVRKLLAHRKGVAERTFRDGNVKINYQPDKK